MVAQSHIYFGVVLNAKIVAESNKDPTKFYMGVVTHKRILVIHSRFYEHPMILKEFIKTTTIDHGVCLFAKNKGFSILFEHCYFDGGEYFQKSIEEYSLKL